MPDAQRVLQWRLVLIWHEVGTHARALPRYRSPPRGRVGGGGWSRRRPNPERWAAD